MNEKHKKDLPNILLSVSGCVFTASGVTEDGIVWEIYSEAEDESSARCKIKVNLLVVADITVHQFCDNSIVEEVQNVCAALVWSGIRSIRNSD